MKQFFDSVKLGLVSPVYLFYGNEPLLLDEAVNSLRRILVPEGGDWNTEFFYGDSVSIEEVVNSASTAPFFAGRRLIVVKNIPWLSVKNEDGKDDALLPLLSYLEAPSNDTCLVFTVRGQVDKRRKLVSAIAKAGRVVEFVVPTGSQLNIWLERRFQKAGKKVSGEVIHYLTLVAGENLAFLAMEVDKLCLYCGQKQEITMEDALQVVSKSSLLSIFEMLDAVSSRQAARAVELYRGMVRQGEAEQKILVMLAKQLRDMLAVQSMLEQGYRQGDIAKELGLHPYVAGKYQRMSGQFSRRELIGSLEILLAADIANKSGEGELYALLEIAIMRICAF